MKTVKLYWELHMTEEHFQDEKMQELIIEIKSGKFQREMEAGKFDTGKIQKCIATVKVE